jgi:hypothetical protein
MTDPVPSNTLFTIIQPPSIGDLHFNLGRDTPFLTLHADGRITIGQGVTAAGAAKEFLSALELAFPQWVASLRAAPEPKPAHEREPPHCSTCACGLAPEPCLECEKRKHANDRINYETTDDGFRICRGYHHRSADCEWEYYVRRSTLPPGAGQ